MKGAYVSMELRIFEHLSLPYELLLQCGIVLVFEGDCDSSIPCRLADMDLQSKDPAECCHSSRRHHGSVHGAFCCQKFKSSKFLRFDGDVSESNNKLERGGKLSTLLASTPLPDPEGAIRELTTRV